MTVVRSRRPGLLVLLTLLIVFALNRCRTADPLSLLSVPAGNPCAANPNPPPNSHAPIICIDDRTMPPLIVRPDPANAYRSTVIQWWTVTGQPILSIGFDSPSPVGYIACLPDKGYCRSMVSPSASGTHKYTVTVTHGDKVATLDPTIIIDTN